MDNLKIEILSFTGCPNVEHARTNVAEALAAEGKTASITDIEVDTPERATQHRFLGSPSVRINGSDVESTADSPTNYGLMCRTYTEDAGVSGAPSVWLIRAKLKSLAIA